MAALSILQNASAAGGKKNPTAVLQTPQVDIEEIIETMQDSRDKEAKALLEDNSLENNTSTSGRITVDSIKSFLQNYSPSSYDNRNSNRYCHQDRNENNAPSISKILNSICATYFIISGLQTLASQSPCINQCASDAGLQLARGAIHLFFASMS